MKIDEIRGKTDGELSFELDKLTAEIRPGVTAQVVIVGDQVRDALYLPRQAIFEKEGKLVAYVRGRDGFAPRDVKVLHRTESQVAIEGLNVGDEVALVNPEAKGKGKSGAASAAPAGGPSLKVGGAK